MSMEIPLKDHFEKILIEKDRAITIALDSAKDAIEIAERTSEKWRDNANEWRAAMTDRERMFLQRGEFEIYVANTNKVLEIIQAQLNKNLGQKQGVQEGWGWLAGLFGIILTIFNILDFVK